MSMTSMEVRDDFEHTLGVVEQQGDCVVIARQCWQQYIVGQFELGRVSQYAILCAGGIIDIRIGMPESHATDLSFEDESKTNFATCVNEVQPYLADERLLDRDSLTRLLGDAILPDAFDYAVCPYRTVPTVPGTFSSTEIVEISTGEMEVVARFRFRLHSA